MGGSRALTDTEKTTILDYLERGRNPARDRALILFGLRAGFRISELLSLTVSDVWSDGKVRTHVRVKAKEMKGGVGRAPVKIHRDVAEALVLLVAELPQTGDSVLFRSRQGTNRAIGRGAAWAMLVKAYKACGVEGKLGTHCMRKTFAQKVHKKNGGDLFKTQKALGHKEITSTVSYLAVDDSDIDDLIDSLD